MSLETQNDTFPGENALLQTYTELKASYAARQGQNMDALKERMQRWRDGFVSKEAFAEEAVADEKGLGAIQKEITDIEDTIRICRIKQMNELNPPDQKRQYIESLELDKTIGLHKGESVQAGGGAKGVYTLDGLPNLVAIEKGKRSYQYCGELPARTQKFEGNPRILRVYHVFNHMDTTFTVMERAKGRQLDTLKREEVEQIPDAEIRQFIKDIMELRDSGLFIDPRPSNFFYDPGTGIEFIDLSYSTSIEAKDPDPAPDAATICAAITGQSDNPTMLPRIERILNEVK